MDEGRSRSHRVDVTKERHGADFYQQIGRRTAEFRQRARAGDPDVLARLQRRREARPQRLALWLAVVEAREAVTLLRAELASRARANAKAPRAALGGYFRY